MARSATSTREQMIEETLNQYGALGAVIVFFMGTLTWILKWVTSRLSQVVENNTIALTKVYAVINNCPNQNR